MKIKCPYCGNDDLSFMESFERVPSYRAVFGLRAPSKPGGKQTLVLAEEGDVFWEGAEKSVLVCRECDMEFDIPEDLAVDYMSESEYESLKKDET